MLRGTLKSSKSQKPILLNFKDWFLLMLQGICMGAADIVPGISGGTMAFIMGIYERLLLSINTFSLTNLKLLTSLQFRQFFQNIAWEFLLALGFGIFTAFLLLANALHAILNDPIWRTYLYAAFMGLIIASIYFCAKQIPKWTLLHIFGLLAGIVAAFFLTTISFKANEELWDVSSPIALSHDVDTSPYNYDKSRQVFVGVNQATLSAMLAKGVIVSETMTYNMAKEPLPVKEVIGTYHHTTVDYWLIFCGVVAVTALLLPGISGSYMLTVLGVYPLVIGALADFTYHLKHFRFDVDAFSILGHIALGVMIGGVIFARGISWLLKHYKSTTISIMTGFMIGALKAVWPFWTYEYYLNPLKVDKGVLLELKEVYMPPLNDPTLWLAVGCAFCGAALVLVIEWMANRKTLRKAQDRVLAQ